MTTVKKPGALVLLVLTVSLAGAVDRSTPTESLGVGIVMPSLDPAQPLYVYGVSDLDTLPEALSPQDSVVFRAGPHYVDIATAPPWFVPRTMKLDYGLLHLRAKTLARHWIEVVVNERTGATRWVDRSAVRFEPWPVFLLGVVTVEVDDPTANPIRSGPDATAPVRARSAAFLRPLAVQGDWLRVGPSPLADEQVPTGWIRWREGGRLLITYSLLS
ncbi:MAG: hypothetical protein GVY18_01160 [Bacteroidetes bacterium]|jgi:hypothetical protein|nr:hypothetical protein [Bacteroidota bacterium]